MQLVAYGAQDIYLTGNPQITFFKGVYKRHTNFSVEAVEIPFNGTADFGKKVSCTITRQGDLVERMYLKTTIKGSNIIGNFGWVSKIGYSMIKSYELLIGGSRIDKQYGDWMNIWYELEKGGYETSLEDMIGNLSSLKKIDGSSTNSKETILFVPLFFFFCRNIGLALPLIALQYHDVRLDMEFRSGSECINLSGSSAVCTPIMTSTTLLVNYIYLDSEERKKFAQSSHEYLIEQLQMTEETINTISHKVRLNFNHPCKALYWAQTNNTFTNGNTFYSKNNLEDATKNIVLAYRDKSENTNLTAGKTVTPTANIGVTLTNIFTGAVLIKDQTGDLTNLTKDDFIVNTLLTATQASMTTTELQADAGFGNSTATIEDTDTKVTLYQWDNYGRYINYTHNPTSTGQLQLNGHDRFSIQPGKYFNYVQPFQHHERGPMAGVNIYSFALNPADHQPSGTCNFSRIDNAVLNLTFTSNTPSKLVIYTVNYNIFRVMSGMGGLAYNN